MTNDVDVYGGSATSAAIDKLTNGRATVFSTIQGDDFASKLAVLNAVTASEPLADNLDKNINLVDVVVQSIDMPDENTGEIIDVPRVILIDVDGTAYHAISTGIFRSVENMIGILGHPSGWPAPVPVKAVKGKAAKGVFFSLVPAGK